MVMLSLSLAGHLEIEADADEERGMSDVSLRPFNSTTGSIRGNDIDTYPVDRAFTHFSV